MGDEDKQFEASQQKLQKARKEGQVVKSKDFSTALGLLVMFTFIVKMSPFIWNQILKLFVYLGGDKKGGYVMFSENPPLLVKRH